MYKLSNIEKMLAASVMFTMLLLVFRMVYARNFNFIFYAWNFMLAAIPLIISRKLKDQHLLNKRTVWLLVLWLLFLPNAPYIVTDLFHFRERFPVPKWYDLLLVTSAAWNGLMIGFVSVMNAEQFIAKFTSRRNTLLLVVIVFILCGYGIYIGRFLRFNSWDVITNPFRLFIQSGKHLLMPFRYQSVWKFTLLFATLLSLSYFSIKQLGIDNNRSHKINNDL